MKSSQTNQLNTCCYNHLIENRVFDSFNNAKTKMNSEGKILSSQITNFFKKGKFWFMDLTLIALLSLVTICIRNLSC